MLSHDLNEELFEAKTINRHWKFKPMEVILCEYFCIENKLFLGQTVYAVCSIAKRKNGRTDLQISLLNDVNEQKILERWI